MLVLTVMSIDYKAFCSTKGLSVLIQRTYSEMSKPFIFEERKIDLRVSAGYSSFNDDGSELEDLIEKADKSMYEEKRNRKGLRLVR